MHTRTITEIHTSLLLCCLAQLASWDTMATVVAKNIKEAWEVEDTVCVCVCVCALRWRTWSWKTRHLYVKNSLYCTDNEAIQSHLRNKQVVFVVHMSSIWTVPSLIICISGKNKKRRKHANTHHCKKRMILTHTVRSKAEHLKEIVLFLIKWSFIHQFLHVLGKKNNN